MPCFTRYGTAEWDIVTMSPDGSQVFGGLSTEYEIYDFGATWTYIDTIDLGDLYGDDWQFSGVKAGIVIVAGVMYAFDQVLELDGTGGVVPGAEHHGALMKFDPSDGSNFEMLYHWTEDLGSITAAITTGRLHWHPSTPDTIWIVKSYEGESHLQSWDIPTGTLTTHITDIWPGTFTYAELFVWEWAEGFVFLLIDNDSSEYRIVAWHIGTDSYDTLDFDTSSDFTGYPIGLDYEGRLFFSSTGDAVDGYRQISSAGIGTLAAYTACDIFATEFGHTAMYGWFAPADRSVVYMTDGSDVFALTIGGNPWTVGKSARWGERRAWS